MNKCDYCKKKKETKTIHTLDDENSIRYDICKECAKIECPYLDWNKLSDWSK